MEAPSGLGIESATCVFVGFSAAEGMVIEPVVASAGYPVSSPRPLTSGHRSQLLASMSLAAVARSRRRYLSGSIQEGSAVDKSGIGRTVSRDKKRPICPILMRAAFCNMLGGCSNRV